MADLSRQMRISDGDRQVAADRLRAAANEGRLSVGEYDNRLGRVYEAVTYEDLDRLFYDLPNPAMQQQMMAPPVMPQPMTGPIAGPAAVVYNQVVVGGPTILPSSGSATAGMVLGILALIGFWIPFLDFVLGALAIVLSIVGLTQTSGNQLSGRGKAIAGLIMGIISLLPAILFFTLVFAAVSSIP